MVVSDLGRVWALQIGLLTGLGLAQAAGCLIATDTVGAVHSGLTVAQARQVLRGATLRPSLDAAGLRFFLVIRDGLHTMDLYTVGGDLKESSKIELMRVFDGACATADGVHPGMTLDEAGRRLGRLKRLRVTDTESREYAEFERLPSWLRIQVGNGQAGIYPPGKRCTTNYAPAAHIASLWVSGAVNNQASEDESTCNIPRQKR
jgi:hypothetical protein